MTNTSICDSEEVDFQCKSMEAFLLQNIESGVTTALQTILKAYTWAFAGYKNKHSYYGILF